MSSADNFANSLDPDQAWHNVCQAWSGSETVWDSDGIPEFVFENVNLGKKSADNKNSQHAKSKIFAVGALSNTYTIQYFFDKPIKDLICFIITFKTNYLRIEIHILSLHWMMKNISYFIF